MNENYISTKTITELLEMNFYIPEYQRGYRWTKNNVLQLLNDIWEYRQDTNNQHTFYCLQPVVVRKHSWESNDGNKIEGYELIDGQQRLTTIHRMITYLMLEFLKVDSLKADYKKEVYHLYYKTRLQSKEFLSSNTYDNSKPDLYYMSEAYSCIKNWFEDEEKGLGRAEKNRFLDVLLPELKVQKEGEAISLPEWSVQVIWYEIKDSSQKSEELFTRLNRGKIPLTSAELIKAKFVNADSFKGLHPEEKIKRRTQLIQIWDEMENQLNNHKFWAFISNDSIDKYSNKIEYLFDIITAKKANEKDPLFSFVHFFTEKETAETLWSKWMQLEELYRSLLFWFSNREYYHKVGYLIATGMPIKILTDKRRNCRKADFEHAIHELIGNSIHANWEALTYEKSNQHTDLIKVLLLVNIELTLRNSYSQDFFPFEQYKRITKSLEHIHAQNVEGINQNNKSEWKFWLNAHLSVLPQIATDKKKSERLIAEILATDIDDRNYTYEDFKKHSASVLNLIPSEDLNEAEYMHNVENMALLGLTENIMLSNSVFEVKRRKIIEMDRQGYFIPQATKRIFLKYYDGTGTQHYAVWTKAERESYLNDIRSCIQKYKPEITDADAE